MQQHYRTARAEISMIIQEENAFHATKTAKLALVLRNTIVLHVPKGS